MVINNRMLIITFTLIGLLLIANNASYYWFSKTSLTNALSDRMESTAQQIRISIEHSEQGSFYVEDIIGESLRSIAIFAQSELDPDINRVTNEQLAALSRKAGINGISLFKKVDDDIIALKSSDPKEIGLSTKNFGYWFTAFNQLLEHRNVTISQGKSLPNFWTGPYEVPSSGTSSVAKFGYYFDGSTNYIICTFVNVQKIQEFKK